NRAQSIQVGDIALSEGNSADLLVRQDLPQTLGIFFEIVDPNLVAALQEILGNPGAEATVSAGQKDAHKTIALCSYRDTRANRPSCRLPAGRWQLRDLRRCYGRAQVSAAPRLFPDRARRVCHPTNRHRPGRQRLPVSYRRGLLWQSSKSPRP